MLEELQKLVEELRQQNVVQAETIAHQQAEIEALMVRIEELLIQVGKNSNNSSKPPSSDGYAKENRAARRREERYRGKQKGAPGNFLVQVDDPDEIVTHRPPLCVSCGADLSDTEVIWEERRQPFDLPDIRPHVTEHRSLRCQCTECGAMNKGDFPVGVDAPAVYGPRIRAVATYGHIYQHIPYDRLAELLKDVCNMPVSVGALPGIVAKAGVAVQPFCDAVKGHLIAAPAVHFDETGGRVESRLHWIHSGSTPKLTLYTCHPKRGTDAMDDMGVLPKMKGVSIHDGWSPYRKYEVTNGLCNAHHLRELEGVSEGKGQKWAERMISFLCDAKEQVKKARGKGNGHLSWLQMRTVRTRYEALVKAGYAANPPPKRGSRHGYNRKAFNLLKRLDEHREDVLRFCTNFDVPFDNNLAERDIRMVKLQQKISGCWRTLEGAKTFCSVRSYISTMRKQDQNILAGLELLFNGQVWLPQPT